MIENRSNRRSCCQYGGVGLLCALMFGVSGCHNKNRTPFMATRVAEGSYALASQEQSTQIPQDVNDREYVISRMRMCILALADGHPDSVESTVNQIHLMLRTQGLNDDHTVGTYIAGEGVRIWKGEPFEQAMMYLYIGLQKAVNGEWDNARAAAANSLFLLKNYGDEEDASGNRKRLSIQEIVQQAMDQSLDEQTVRVRTTIYSENGESLAMHSQERKQAKTEESKRSQSLQTVRQQRLQATPQQERTSHTYLIRVPLWAVNVADAEFFKRLHRECEVTLLPDETIDGTTTHVIQALPRSDLFVERLVFWFNAETAVAVQTKLFQHNGKTLLVRSLKQVEVNAAPNEKDLDRPDVPTDQVQDFRHRRGVDLMLGS